MPVPRVHEFPYPYCLGHDLYMLGMTTENKEKELCRIKDCALTGLPQHRGLCEPHHTESNLSRSPRFDPITATPEANTLPNKTNKSNHTTANVAPSAGSFGKNREKSQEKKVSAKTDFAPNSSCTQMSSKKCKNGNYQSPGTKEFYGHDDMYGNMYNFMTTVIESGETAPLDEPSIQHPSNRTNKKPFFRFLFNDAKSNEDEKTQRWQYEALDRDLGMFSDFGIVSQPCLSIKYQFKIPPITLKDPPIFPIIRRESLRPRCKNVHCDGWAIKCTDLCFICTFLALKKQPENSLGNEGTRIEGIANNALPPAGPKSGTDPSGFTIIPSPQLLRGQSSWRHSGWNKCVSPLCQRDGERLYGGFCEDCFVWMLLKLMQIDMEEDVGNARNDGRDFHINKTQS